MNAKTRYMKVTVYVEKQPGQKNCSCYIKEVFDGCALAGYGATVEEALEDLKVAREELVDMGHDIPELEISCSYDIWAFFDKYPLNITAMAKRIGINPSLLRQYVSGIRKPSRTRVAEIETAVRDFGRELSSTSLSM